MKRTDVAIKTVKAAFPDAELAGQVNAVDQPGTARRGRRTCSQAHPDINMILTFNTVSGKGAIQASAEAGKDDPNKFFIGMADTEPETQDLIAKGGNPIVQANWGALFEISAVLMIRDSLAFAKGEKDPPTRGLGGRLLGRTEDVAAFRAIANEPDCQVRAARLQGQDPREVQRQGAAGQSINSI